MGFDTARLLFNKDVNTDSHFWENQLDALYKLLNNHSFDTENYFNKVLVPPVNSLPPSLWFLGLSSYKKALKYKGNLCLSYFHTPNIVKNKGILVKFKNDFFQMHGYYPEVSLGIKSFCSNDSNLIEKQKKIHRKEEEKRGLKIPFIVGSIEECYFEILNLRKAEGFDEIVLINQIPDFEIKMSNLKNFGQLANKKQI